MSGGFSLNAGIILAVVILVAGVAFMSRSSSVDLAGPVRNWFNRHDARKVERQDPRPATLRRTYWSLREYRIDAQRYAALGYDTVSEDLSDPHVVNPIVEQVYEDGRGSMRRMPPPRHRVPVARVVYRLRGLPPEDG